MTAAFTVPDSVWVALIGATAVVLAAWLPTRHARREIQRRVGEPNGHGTLMEIGATLIGELASLRQVTVDLDHKLDAHTAQDAENFAELRDAIEASGSDKPPDGI